MIIQDLTHETKDAFVSMCIEFYSSEAVIHHIPIENITNTAAEALRGNPFLRCLIFKEGTNIIGYSLLSFTYANEVGGMVMFIDELSINKEYRGLGYAKEFFKWLFEQYDGQVKRYRLEVSHENESVCRMYESFGFEELMYKQMFIDK